MKRVFFALAILLTALAVLMPADAENDADQWDRLFAINTEKAPGYGDVSEAWALEPGKYPFAPADAVIELLPERARLTGDAELIANDFSCGGLLTQPETNPYLLSTGSGDSRVEWEITVECGGIYELEINYLCEGGNETRIQRRLCIDGAVPYEEANNLCFYRAFQEEVQENGKMKTNAIGDEVWPHQVELHLWQTARAVDQQAIYTDPVRFYLTEGTHTVSLEYVDQPVILGTAAFLSPKVYPSYADRLKEWQADGAPALSAETYIKIQGENSAWRSENVIRRESDADPLTEPRSGIQRVLDRKSTRLNSSHPTTSRMPSSA